MNGEGSQNHETGSEPRGAVIQKIHYRESSVKVELDNDEKLPLSLDAVVAFSLSSEKKLTEQEVELLRHASRTWLCRQKALNYLSYRNRSEGEMKLYLRKKSFDPEYIEETISWLHERKYLDDRSFAVNYIESVLRRKTIGKQRIIGELRQKGVCSADIEGAFEEAEMPDNGDERLMALAEKKWRSIKDKERPLERLRAFLYQRGFSGDEIKVVLKAFRNLTRDDEF